MRVSLSLLVCFLFFPTICLGQIIKDIQVEGNSRVETETILLQVESERGEELDRQQLASDIKDIYRTGFFSNVSAELSTKSELIFIVREKDAIRNVYLEGNDAVGKDSLKEILDSDTRRFLDDVKLKAAIGSAKDYYESQGYVGTEITYNTESVGDKLVDLTFQIKEGKKRRVREVRFEGADAFSQGELEGEIETSSYSWLSSWITGSGIASEQGLEQDVRLLSRFYLKNGYANVQISQPEIVEVDDGVAVVFGINEGEQYSFGQIQARGDLLEGNESLTLAEIEIEPGEIFNLEQLREDTFFITEKFTDIGFAFTNVQPQTDLDKNSKTVKVTFNIDRGDKIKVNRITVSGNKKTRDNVVRRSLTIDERETYSSSKIKRSQILLQRLGYFDEVTITPSPTAQPNEVDLDIQVREGQTGTFSLGAGVSSGDGVLFSSRITENNLFGYGNSLSMDINTGTRRENYVLSFSDPRINDSRWSGGVDLLSVKREFDDFDRSQAGGSLTVGYPLWFLGEEYLEDIRFSLRYEALRIKIDEVSETAPQLVMDEEGSTTSSSITPRLVRNTIDNPLDPTAGSRQSIGVELAGLGGKEKFWLAKVNNTFYYPFVETSIGPLVFANRINFGWGETYNDDRFPLFRRFFSGGIDSVRGFDSRELGPKDEEGSEFGGNKQFVSNFELILPVLQDAGLKMVLFYDIGNAFDDDIDIEFDEFRQAVGWGIRWRSPIAPIRIEIGYPLDREEGEDSVVTHFSFGAPR